MAVCISGKLPPSCLLYTSMSGKREVATASGGVSVTAGAVTASGRYRYPTGSGGDQMCIRDSNKVKAAGSATVTKAERKEKTEETPLLYDLTTLQKEANAKHGFTAEQTLEIAQKLYEKKLIDVYKRQQHGSHQLEVRRVQYQYSYVGHHL